MRAIEFRAWDEQNKIMHHDFQFIKSGNAGNDWIIFISDKFPLKKHETNPFMNPSPYFSQQLKIMQFTGLLDKNGVKIFEGDVLELREPESDGKQTGFGRVIVKFGEYDTVEIDGGDVSLGWYVEGYHGYKRTNGSKDQYEKLDSLLTCMKDRWSDGWEVIGNIHEHPHLMEGK